MSVIESTLFKHSGTIGDLVFRIRNGKVQIYLKPTTYRTPKTPYQKKKSSNWRICAGLCSALNKVKTLRELWREKMTTQIGTFNFMMSCNYKKLQTGSSFSQISLVPSEELFPAQIITSEMNEKRFKVKFEVLAFVDKYNLMYNLKISLQGILCLENPVDKDDIKILFIPLHSGDSNTSYTDQMEFEIIFDSFEEPKINNYNSKKILVNLITKNTMGDVSRISQNCYLEF